MKIAITDDIRDERKKICAMVSDAFGKVGFPVTAVSEFESGEALLQEFRTGKFDFIILDMFMDGLNGYETALEIRRLDKDVKLVFCTTSNDFASESYEVGACYYLRKPVKTESFLKMLSQINLTEYEATRYITLPDRRKLILRRICYTEYINHLILVHMAGGETVKVRTTQAALEEALCKFNFLFVCSKGIVVNFFEIKSLKNNMFLMKDGTCVPISRRKLKETEDAYTSFLFDRTRREVL